MLVIVLRVVDEASGERYRGSGEEQGRHAGLLSSRLDNACSSQLSGPLFAELFNRLYSESELDEKIYEVFDSLVVFKVGELAKTGSK